MQKKRMISGIKPTGSSITLGNYIGALKQFVSYQDDFELIVFIADLHALTVHNDPEQLKQNTENLVATYLAAGLDPEKVILFKQSDVLEHTMLEWILTCNTNLAELTKMPQYKNYIDKHKGEPTPTGMLMYPSLMNADILLYDAELVPVGEDQKPHVDLTRDVADKFNKTYGDTFILPEAVLAKQGAKIMSLSDPTKKMSKSESEKGTIYLMDDEQTVRRKFRKATTDNEGRIYYDPVNKPGISNLLVILSSITGKSIEALVANFAEESDYGVFKDTVAKAVCLELSQIQDRIAKIKSSGTIEAVLAEGKKKAEKLAAVTLDRVYRQIGLK